jgi:hypothetical protein
MFVFDGVVIAVLAEAEKRRRENEGIEAMPEEQRTAAREKLRERREREAQRAHELTVARLSAPKPEPVGLYALAAFLLGLGL